MHVRRSGFTLIEMLVALAVFAVVGLLANRLVTEVLRHQEAAQARGARLAELQRAFYMMQRDVIAVNGRGVRDSLGSPLPPLIIDPDGMLELTRSGWRNPLRLPRAEVQRVGYALVDDTLKRVYWSVLDRSPDSEPIEQDLLTGVETVAFYAVDQAGNEHTFWPLAAGGANPANRLAAIGVRMSINPYGDLERLWPVPSI